MARNVQQNDIDQIPNYITRLTRVPLLTVEQEREITKKVSEGDLDAKRRLVEANMRLVVNIARSYRTRSISVEDLIQEGLIGLMQAAERFEPARELRFSTYATHWIRQAIGRAIDNKSKAIRLPAHISQTLRKIEREKTRLTKELGHDPSPDQLAHAIGVSPHRLSILLQASREIISLETPVGDGSGATLGSMIQDNGRQDPEAQMLTSEVASELRRILSELNEREQRIVKLRFCLEPTDEPFMQDKVALEMKLSRERVRQIELQAIKKLRQLAQRRRLREMLG